MFHRYTTYLLLALIPAVLLGILFPDRILRGPHGGDDVIFESVRGAPMLAFVRDGCPHCADFKEFVIMQGWQVEYHDITDLDAQTYFSELQKTAPGLQQGVPTIVIDGNIIQGYETHETTGKMLKELFDECQESDAGCQSFADTLASTKPLEVQSAAAGICTENCEANLDKYVFDFWFIGKVDLTRLSLPALAILLGFLDGFNPCAMWVLITLLTLLINTHEMRKVWVVGGTFLLVSGAVYYIFIAAWLNVFLLLGYNLWVQKIIGLVAIGGASFYLFEAFGQDPNVCRITSREKRQRTIACMQMVLQKTAWPAMILGVAILAISVNMIELVCTAGLPAVFTQILAFNDVSNLARYALIGLFILMYMIDDFIIFAIAVYTLHATGMTTKYRRFTMIFGGLLMYVLGLLLIFAPEALSFG